MFFYSNDIYYKGTFKEYNMKNLLSENLLRFGVKNLTESAKKELIVKSIMETIDQHGLRNVIKNKLTEQDATTATPVQWNARGLQVGQVIPLNNVLLANTLTPVRFFRNRGDGRMEEQPLKVMKAELRQGKDKAGNPITYGVLVLENAVAQLAFNIEKSGVTLSKYQVLDNVSGYIQAGKGTGEMLPLGRKSIFSDALSSSVMDNKAFAQSNIASFTKLL